MAHRSTSFTVFLLLVAGCDAGTISAPPGAGPLCGDGVKNGTELCDGSDLGGASCAGEGLGGGTLSCLADCSGFVTSACDGAPGCGNGRIDAPEICDGAELGGATCASRGFDAGSLACAAGCAAFDESGCHTCGDSAVSGPEICDGGTGARTCQDEGFDGGTLACAATCDAYDTSACTSCGDALVEGAELCDSSAGLRTCIDEGFDGGTLACAASCEAYDTSACHLCGNGAIEGPEDCDGTNLGGLTCSGAGFVGGTLACAACVLDTSGCHRCGDGAIDAGELCDGAEVGTRTCADEGFVGGTLGCLAACDAYDTSACNSCGNDARDAGEVCDGTDLASSSCQAQGFFAGTLACAASCGAFDTSGCHNCGNGTRQAGEDCDGSDLGTAACTTLGFASGTLACDAACGFDMSSCVGGCGNDLREGSELCDGSDLAGATCISQGQPGGTLGCAANCLAFDTSSCWRCGDGSRQGSELCDGADLAGESCVTQGFDGGSLACAGGCGAFDASGCRSCPASCPSGGSCVDGLCQCGLYLTDCAGSCVSTRTDPTNCGGCSVACDVGAGEVCSAGQCTSGCNAPLVACGGVCVDTLSDNAHCGGCPGVACGGSDVCVDGVCAAPATSLTTPDKCAGGGPQIDLNLGTGTNPVPGAISCTGDLAAVSFRWALCSCNDIGGANAINQALFTDGFNSSVGPYDPRCEDGTTECAPNDPTTQPPWSSSSCDAVGDLDGDGINVCGAQSGAGIGANQIYQNSSTTVAQGAVWWRATSVPSIGTLSADQELHIGGVLPGDVYGRDDAFVSGNVTATGGVSGVLHQSPSTAVSAGFTYASRDTSAPVVVPEPCDCAPDKLINVVGLVDAHACTGAGTGAAKCAGNAAVNDNSLVGLSPDQFVNAGGRVDLPCGQYYLSGIDSNADVTIVAQGRTVLYISGDVNIGSSGSLSLLAGSSAELDVFIRGGMCIGGSARIGSPAYPRRTRIYVAAGSLPSPTGGSGPAGCTPNNAKERALDLKNFVSAANVYAPWGTIYMPQDLLMYGGLFIGGFNVTQQTAIHFDTSVASAGDTCSASCGNGVIDLGEVCDGSATGGRSCETEGFASGALACNATCTGLDTSGCVACPPGGCVTTVCGDGVKDASEVCDGTDLGGASCTALGFVSGTLACNAFCNFDTSGCSGGCLSCRDCDNQACIGGQCTMCQSDADCCAPLMCLFGTCTIF